MSGLDTLRGMGKRRVPEPLHPREQGTATPAPVEEGGSVAPVEESAPLPELDTSPPEVTHSARNTPTTAARRGRAAPAPLAGARAERTATRAYQHRDEEQVNLGVRVPRELDNRLLGLVYQLRMQGVRVSKAELVAMALEELPEDATPALLRRVAKRAEGG